MVMVYYHKNLCNKGDIYIPSDSRFSRLCDVDYLLIAELAEYIKTRKSHDSQYFAKLKELKNEMTKALAWESY